MRKAAKSIYSTNIVRFIRRIPSATNNVSSMRKSRILLYVSLPYIGRLLKTENKTTTKKNHQKLLIRLFCFAYHVVCVIPSEISLLNLHVVFVFWWLIRTWSEWRHFYRNDWPKVRQSGSENCARIPITAMCWSRSWRRESRLQSIRTSSIGASNNVSLNRFFNRQHVVIFAQSSI